MKNVTCYRLLILFFSSLVVLSGCKEPEVSLGELGKKMAAPQLKGTSPFDQDFNANNYARLQGTCSARVGDLSISFDNSTWYSIPSVPNYTGSTLAGTETNDVSCLGDGTFDFYLTESDMTSWGIPADSNIDYIYLRGSTIVGDTHTLTLKDPKLDGGNGNSSPATQVVLQKYWPENFAGTSQCEYFMANLRDANGNYASSSNSAVNFSIDKKVDSTVYSQVTAYSTMSDCQASTNPATSFSIPAGQNSIQVYYRFPDAPINGVIYFRTSNVNLATTTSTFSPVTLRDSTGDRFWFSTHSYYRVTANFNARFYNGTMKSFSGSDTITPSVVGTNASKLEFYSDSSCSTKISVVPGYMPNNQFFFKYVGTEISTDVLSFTINYTLTGASIGSSYDIIPHKIEIDRSGSTTVTHINLSGPMTLTRGSCTHLNLAAFNNKGALTPTSANVSLTPAWANSKFYATQSDCDSQVNNMTSVQMAGSSAELWFRTVGDPGSNETISLSASGINTPSRTFVIDDKATSFALFINGNSTALPYPYSPTCVQSTVEVKLTDNLRDRFYQNNFGTTLMITVARPYGYTLYSDSSCANALAGDLGMSISSGAYSTGAFNYWIKADSTPAQYNFQVYLTNAPLPGEPYLSAVSYPVILGP